MTYTAYLTFTVYVNSIENPFPSGTAVMAAFLPQSPFVQNLGVTADILTDDAVALRMPWQPSLATVGDMVHGGAISALADMAIMATAWCGRPAPDQLRGVTTSMSLEFLNPAYRTDLIATGRVLQRGRSLSACEVEISTDAGEPVAKAIGRYKVG